MWRVKLTSLRARLGVDEQAVKAQNDHVAAAPLPPPRAQTGRTAAVLKGMQGGGGGGGGPAGKEASTAELLQELQWLRG